MANLFLIPKKVGSIKILALMTLVGLLLFGSFSAKAQKAPLIKLVELQRRIDAPSEQIKVINFWATWCAPCIKELPLFEKLQEQRKAVAVTLVSMDIDLDPDPQKVHRYVERKKIKSEVVILDERNPDSWIDKIDKKWSGALPATLVVNTKTGKRKFIEKELHEGDLEALIEGVK